MFWIVVAIILVIFYFVGKNSPAPRKYKAGTILMLGEKTASDMLDEIELKQVSIRLNPDEACYYEGIGTAYNSKDIVTGYNNKSNGYSIRPMKGLSFVLQQPESP